MKYTITIDKNRDEEVLIFVREKTELIDKIESLLQETNSQIIGYRDSDIVPLNEKEIFCFIVENNKVYALTDKEKYALKLRLYRLEEILSEDFIKINQSSIANLRKIKKFDSSISGSLKVVFQNGYTDYISRRNIKKIKERFGI